MKNNYIKASTALALLAAFVSGASAQTVYSEDFEAVTISNQVGPFPSGWVTYGDGKTNQGNFVIFGDAWCVSRVETNNNAAASVSQVNESGYVDRWMVTPAIEVPTAGHQLKFRAFSAGLEGTERLRVMVSTTGQDKASFTTTLRDLVFDGSNAGLSGGWNLVELPLADYAGQTIHVAFVNHGAGRFVFVDDIEVTDGFQNAHMPFMETFTSQHCGNCPDGETELEGAYEGLESRVAWVAHHVGYGDDEFTIEPSRVLESLFGGGTYNPAVMIDRSMAYSEGNPGPVHYVGTAVLMHQELSRASVMPDNIVMGMTEINYNAGTRQLQFTVEGYFIEEQTLVAPRLTVYLAEDSIIAYQNDGTNVNNYRHDHVVRACLTQDWGDDNVITSTAAGDHFSKTFSYTLPSNLRAGKCYLVACVNSYGSDAINGRRVYNATKSGYITQDNGSQLGIEEACRLHVKTYPNPAASHAVVSAGATIRSAMLLTADGRVAMRMPSVNADVLDLDLSELRNGTYIISVVTDEGVANGRIIVVK